MTTEVQARLSGEYFGEAVPEAGIGAAQIVDRLHRDGRPATVATIGGRRAPPGSRKNG